MDAPRRLVALFDLTEDDFTDENLDATVERIVTAIRERSAPHPQSSPTTIADTPEIGDDVD